MPYFPAKIAPSYKARKVGPQSNLSHIIRTNQPPNIGVRGEAPNLSRQSAPLLSPHQRISAVRKRPSRPSGVRRRRSYKERLRRRARSCSYIVYRFFLLHANASSLIISLFEFVTVDEKCHQIISELNRQVFHMHPTE